MRLLMPLALTFLSSAAWGDEELWDLLASKENVVVVMRHAHAADGDPLVWDETGNCRGERVLTEKGKAHARSLAERFASYGITPVVISSPMCRCLETVEIAFGVEPITDPVLREVASADAERIVAFETEARTLLTRHRGVRPVVFASHRPNINLLTLELIDTEDLLVGEIDESGEIEVLGKITLHP